MHRVCIAAEHDPQNGKMHGCCIVCAEPWPCEDSRNENVVLIKEVYEFLVKSADNGCTLSNVLGGDPCGNCLPCIAKPLERKIRERSVKESWGRNPYDIAENYYDALYAIRAICEHSGGKKTIASKMRGEINNIRKIADDVIINNHGERP